MNACLASANTAVAMPTMKIPIPSTRGVGAIVAISRPPMATNAAPIMAVRSPMRLMSQPLGMSPNSSPTMIIARMNPAMASVAPRLFATSGIIGMIAPSPIEKSRVGRNAETATDCQRKGAASVILIDATRQIPAGCPEGRLSRT